MSFAQDLLDQAYHLVDMDEGEPKQASLRRAISTAYYAVFHLLIDEAVSNWAIERQRSVLARTFDHGRMKKVCEEHVQQFRSAGSPEQGEKLMKVARTFSILQQQRHTADYDSAVVWDRTNATSQIDLADQAFRNWEEIRQTEAAQDYLLSLFLSKQPRTGTAP